MTKLFALKQHQLMSKVNQEIAHVKVAEENVTQNGRTKYQKLLLMVSCVCYII